MIYLIPKKINNQEYNRMTEYVYNLNRLAILFNPDNSIYPRIVNTKKRGIHAVNEIMRFINCFFIEKNNYIEELFYVLKNKFQIDTILNQKIITFNKINYHNAEIDVIIKENFFIIDNKIEAQLKIESVIQTNNLVDIFKNPIEYFKTHLDNLVLTNEEKLDLIKTILQSK
jgi:hypothetical protein